MKSIYQYLIIMVCLLLGKTSSPAQWIQANCPPTLQIDCFAGSGTNIFAGTFSNGVYLSSDNGSNWNEANSGLPIGATISAMAVRGNNLFAGTVGDGIYRSSNNGTTWTADTIGLTHMYVSAFAVLGNRIFAGTWGGVYLSINDGAHWSRILSGSVKALAVSGNNLYNVDDFGSLHISSDSGATWAHVDISVIPVINAFTVFGANIFAGVIGGVYHSTNNGMSWIADTLGFERTSVNSFGFWGADLFVGAGGRGVYLSSQHGTRWPADTIGLMGHSVTALAVFDTNIFAGTSAGKIWKRPLSEVATFVETDQGQASNHYELEQNYPNPFNPATNISFSLSSASFVTVQVFDLLGRRVSTIVFQEMSAGRHTIQWNANGFASGVYLCRFQAGSYRETRKLVLQK